MLSIYTKSQSHQQIFKFRGIAQQCYAEIKHNNGLKHDLQQAIRLLHFSIKQLRYSNIGFKTCDTCFFWKHWKQYEQKVKVFSDVCQVLNIETGKYVHTFTHLKSITSIKENRQGNLVLADSKNNAIYILKQFTGTKLA